MSYLERIKKLSTYSHLPNFAVLSSNKLYLPNSNHRYTVLGKWSLEWINSNKCAIGIVEGDTNSNILFQITSCYECTDDETPFQLVPKEIFTKFWNKVYQNDPFLSYIHIYVSNFYQSSPLVSPKSRLVITKDSDEPINTARTIQLTGSDQVTVRSQTVNTNNDQVTVGLSNRVKTIDLPIVEKPKEETKKENADNFQVCKTDKPDVYHVYQSNKYISTCLIPNMKTSRYMQDLFETKQIGEMVYMNMKLHINTNKYYPII